MSTSSVLYPPYRKVSGDALAVPFRWVGRTLGGRLIRERRRKLTFYHQVDDPHSHLTLQALERLREVYPLKLSLVVVPPPAADVDPEPELRARMNLIDAKEIASYLGLDFPARATSPSMHQARQANAVLLAERPLDETFQAARALGNAIFSGDGEALRSLVSRLGSVPGQDVRPRLEENYRGLRNRGFYQGGVVFYAGEWYRGAERLAYFEERLRREGLNVRAHPTIPRVCSRASERTRSDLPVHARHRGATEKENPYTIDVYFTFRDPHSYLAVERLRRIHQELPLRVRCRPLLPRFLGGLPTSPVQAAYLRSDAFREARHVGVPFGRICDPGDEGAARCVAVALGIREDKVFDFVESALRGIWSEGVDVSRDDGLRHVAARAGVEFTEVCDALNQDGWREIAGEHWDTFRELGLWGVPSFRVGERIAWGQDRVCLLADWLSSETEAH